MFAQLIPDEPCTVAQSTVLMDLTVYTGAETQGYNKIGNAVDSTTGNFQWQATFRC